MNKIDPILPINLTLGNLPTSYKESLSYPEQLQELRHKINEVVTNYNSILSLIDDITSNYEEISERLDNIEVQIQEINDFFPTFREQILSSVDNKNNSLYLQVTNLLNDYQLIFNNSLQNLRNDLETEISRIELGDVKAYNPTNGETENVSKVIMDVYNMFRDNAISCAEFDALELTATTYDEMEITAYNFDVNSKSILLN